MNKVVRKVFSNFDVFKNYKLYRKLQVVANFPYKKGYQDYNVELENRNIRVRVFNKNKEIKNKKTIVFIHGGGWVAGSIESYTNILSILSKELEIPIVAIDYRLAPEYKFPAGFNDCLDIVKLVAKKIGHKNIILMGDSAGGNLCAAVSQKLRDDFSFRIRKQILLYPVLSADYKEDSKYKSVIEKENKYLITRNHLESAISHYVENEKELRNPYVSPINSKRLLFAPKTLIITSENDPLKDEGYMYYKKLKRYFVNVKYYHFEGADHGFLTNPLEKKFTNKLIKIVKEFLNN